MGIIYEPEITLYREYINVSILMWNFRSQNKYIIFFYISFEIKLNL